ncbi:SusC/RagA family TonB-linked outer membrane protein [Dyadobacter bucti]|uniref:SusC/RagA family TonB-linked outer membrane protein n=1 Tax=Dyadobacter bucti TaxID=2572203 RepID=UPI0014094C50|nr:SusC/RagA family TonB-linked outer membrane protein [Dyadobacter bucti]
MKKLLYSQLARSAGYVFLVVIPQLLFAGISQAKEAREIKSIHEVTIRTVYTNALLADVFKDIESRTDFVFTFDAKDSFLKDRYSKPMGTSSVAHVLEGIANSSRLAFQQINQNISVRRQSVGMSVENPTETRMALINVAGKVISAADKQGLPGVSILVKGTTTGTVTDGEGNYSISLPGDDGTLVFSSIGFITQEVLIKGRSTVDVSMEEDLKKLDEVVVTAFGIERDKKSLTYSTQNVDVEAISKSREYNVLNSLAGKVAGLNFQTSSTGVGGTSRIVLRGNRSISGNSQPLYIVDGVPGNLSDLNPDDIESMTVLKGPNAAALYGSQANNGAIVVTTKRGGNTAGRYDVSVSQSYTFEIPNILVDYQDSYGQGLNGQYMANTSSNWGPKMEGQMVDHWSNDPNWAGPKTYAYSPQPNNVRDFFKVGHNSATNLAISTGSEKAQTYFSYTYTDGAGVVPFNELSRHNANLRFSNNLGKRLSIDGKLTYMRQEIKNGLGVSIDYSNPLRHAYRIPRNVRTQDAEIYEFYNDNGIPVTHTWSSSELVETNPYTAVNGISSNSVRDRVAALASMKYNVTDKLSVQIRSSLNRAFENYQNEIKGGISKVSPVDGYFGVSSSESMSLNNDFLVSYNDNISSTLKYNVNVGGNSLINRNTSISANTGTTLTIPNFFTLSNTQYLQASNSVGGPSNINSLYAFGQISYKDAIFLDLTGRNDWSSTLPKSNWSFFYPSVGLNGVVSELVKLPMVISFFKVRGSYAIVGNGTSPFSLSRYATLSRGGKAGLMSVSGTLPNENLKPEKTASLELGGDLRFFEDRLGLDFTYYVTNTTNQLFSISLPPASGASGFFTNGGDVENKGVEMVFTVKPIVKADFGWDIGLNFSKNKNIVKKINDQRPSIVMGNNDLREIRLEQGKQWGGIYVKGFQRDDNGNVIVGPNGIPLYTTGKTVFVGNSEPKWLGGIRNTFRYKKLSLSVLIDVRHGGVISSFANSVLAADGSTKETEAGRDGKLVFGKDFFPEENAVKQDGSVNDLPINVQDFWIGSGGRTAGLVGEIHTSDASNVRLREAQLSYSLPKGIFGYPVSFSLVGRNLFFLSNKAKYLDPEIFVGADNATQSDASFTLPTTRSIGFNVRVNFK